MSVYLPEPGDRVQWTHHDRRGTKKFAGTVLPDGKTTRSGYQRIRRDDTQKVVSIRTWALSKIITP